ncbi:MAG: pentapeptide repeat-containing protein [Dehalococcoidia bacterium]|nr:pentapeptide repeat-containing protein [Dehalococcoidia bacterium]
MGDGTKINPYTRDDVVDLLKKRKSERFKFTGKYFIDGIDLSNLDCSQECFNKARLFRAKFNGSNLEAAEFKECVLDYATFNLGAIGQSKLTGADFQGASLEHAEFRGANVSVVKFSGDETDGVLVSHPARFQDTNFLDADLFRADFKGCFLYGVKFEGASLRGSNIFEAHLEDVNWGNFVIGEEKKGEYWFAETVYRRLKDWYRNAGMEDVAGEFFFREMTVRRKRMSWKPNPVHRVWSKLISILCGYGERPLRVISSAIVLVLGLAIVYFLSGNLKPDSFLDSLYFSAISFTALGYGGWAPEPTGWVKWLGVAESFSGVFLMALFLVTFTRKMTR